MSDAVSGTVLRDILAGCEGVPEGPWEQRHDDEVWDAMGKWFAASTDEGAAHIARLDPQTIASIVSELIARREADVWQPIETATGERVIVAVEDGEGNWIIGEARRMDEAGDDSGWWWAGESPGDYYASRIDGPEPSLWRPLPQPPLSTNEPKPC